jgi:uncharacterized protein (TIGR03067 family)
MQKQFSTFAAIACATAILLGNTLTSRGDTPEKGFKSIFNGKDLSGWDGDPALWSAKDNSIIGETSAAHPIHHNTFLIWTNGTVGDFELRCSFRITPQNDKGFANSGIQYRSKILDKAGWVLGGYQADMEAGPTYTGILYEERMKRGIMALRGQKIVWDKQCLKREVGSLGTPEEYAKAIKKGDWNDYVVIAKGNHLQHFINGKQTIDVTDDCKEQRADRGVLGLQLHQGPSMKVEFRNLRLKNLAGDNEASAEDLKKLQGEWKVAAVEVGGEKAPTDMISKLGLKVRGSEFEVLNMGVKTTGSFLLDSSKSPPRIEIHPETGPSAGKVWPGIYSADHGAVKICYSQFDSQWPSRLDTGSNPSLVLITYNKKAE